MYVLLRLYLLNTINKKWYMFRNLELLSLGTSKVQQFFCLWFSTIANNAKFGGASLGI